MLITLRYLFTAFSIKEKVPKTRSNAKRACSFLCGYNLPIAGKIRSLNDDGSSFICPWAGTGVSLAGAARLSPPCWELGFAGLAGWVDPAGSAGGHDVSLGVGNSGGTDHRRVLPINSRC